MKTVDLTPTWRGLLPVLVEVAANGETAKGRNDAMAELYRLADMADRMKPLKLEAGAAFEEIQITAQAPLEMPHDQIAERVTRAIETALGVEAVREIKFEAEIHSGERFEAGKEAAARKERRDNFIMGLLSEDQLDAVLAFEEGEDRKANKDATAKKDAAFQPGNTGKPWIICC